MDVTLTVVSLRPDDALAQDDAARLLAAELWSGGVGAVTVPAQPRSGATARLTVAGVFSAATVEAISDVAVAFVGRGGALRIRVTAGDVEVDIDGELGDAQRAALARIAAHPA